MTMNGPTIFGSLINHPAPWRPTDSDLSPDSMFLKGETDYEEAAKNDN